MQVQLAEAIDTSVLWRATQGTPLIIACWMANAVKLGEEGQLFLFGATGCLFKTSPSD
ncbi:hypothetical protein RAD15_39000 [Bradyrhizobium sp. 14AA]